MNDQVEPIPKDFHTITPYLVINDAAAAIEFYKKAFGARERMRLRGPDGKVGHAEIFIGDSVVMLADEFPGMGGQSPKTLGSTTISLLIYVEDVDSAFEKAVIAGATIVQDVEDKFYGERSGCVMDPFGHQWTLMTHIEDVSPEEMDRRLAEAYAKMSATNPAPPNVD